MRLNIIQTHMDNIALLQEIRDLLAKYDMKEHSVEFSAGYIQALKDITNAL